MAKARHWTCQKVSNGVKCGNRNPLRLTLCAACKKRRGPTKPTAAQAALADFDYEAWAAVQGEACGICGKPRSPKRRLDRDHEHSAAAVARGLLCAFPCNTGLKAWMTPQWLRQAASYLETVPDRQRKVAEHMGAVGTLDSAPEAPIKSIQARRESEAA